LISHSIVIPGLFRGRPYPSIPARQRLVMKAVAESTLSWAKIAESQST
jgi:hypothetical protein